MITVRFWAAAQEAAGHAEEQLDVATLGDLLLDLGGRVPLAKVLPVCSLLLDGLAVRRDDEDRALPAGSTVDLLPPFAGG